MFSYLWDYPSTRLIPFSHFRGTHFHLLGNLNFYLLPGKYPFSTSWEISISTLYQINTFFHFWGTSYFHFWGTDMWPSHQPILKLSYEESLLFPDKSTATMLCFLTFGINLLPGKYFFPLLGELVSTSWAISIITLYQMNTFFHFKGTSCFLFLGNYMWPSHQTIFELSYEERRLFQHKSTAPMIYILTFENNLLPGKYFSHFWENRFHLLGNLKITWYQINIFFHFWWISCFLFWGNDMWPSHQPIFRALLWGKFALPT